MCAVVVYHGGSAGSRPLTLAGLGYDVRDRIVAISTLVDLNIIRDISKNELGY